MNYGTMTYRELLDEMTRKVKQVRTAQSSAAAIIRLRQVLEMIDEIDKCLATDGVM